MKSFAGIEIVGSRLQIVIGDDRANIHQRYNFSIDGAAGAVMSIVTLHTEDHWLLVPLAPTARTCQYHVPLAPTE